MADEFDEASLDQLVAVALASPGLLGFLGNVVGKIRYKARKELRSICPELVNESAREMLQGTLTEKRGKEKAAKLKAQQLALK
jgi:hypothetical protein